MLSNSSCEMNFSVSTFCLVHFALYWVDGTSLLEYILNSSSHPVLASCWDSVYKYWVAIEYKP